MNPIALLFPGQGSQYIGMGRRLYDTCPVVKQTFDEAGDTLGLDVAKLCFEGPLNQLTLTENAQPAILTVSVAAFRALSLQSNIAPVFTAGHSLGEITALTCAEAIAFGDALHIVRHRGRFMQEAVGEGDGAMAAVSGVKDETVRAACLEASINGLSVVISNFNSNDQVVISGHKYAVQQAGEQLLRQGANVIALQVSAPFHSPLMQPAAERFHEELQRYTYRPLKWPVISNVTAKPYEGPHEIVEMLSRQMTHPVRWVESMNYAVSRGMTKAVELGPQAILSGLMKRIDGSVNVLPYDKVADEQRLHSFLEQNKEAAVSEVAASMAVEERPMMTKVGIPSSKTSNPTHSLLARCLAVAVCTKNRGDASDAYESGVVKPYQEVMKVHLELESTGMSSSVEQERQALLMLHSVFETKQTPVNEQMERFRQVLTETGRFGDWSSFVEELVQSKGWVIHA